LYFVCYIIMVGKATLFRKMALSVFTFKLLNENFCLWELLDKNKLHLEGNQKEINVYDSEVGELIMC
jgi:hypothetical protein